MCGNISYNPYTHLLQQKLNANGLTDKFGNRLKEEGVFGPKTQWASDAGKGIISFNKFSKHQFYPPKGNTVFGVSDMSFGRIKNVRPC